MKICVVLYFHNDRWLKRALSIVHEELDKGNIVTVLDIGMYATPNFGEYQRRLSKFSLRLFPFKHELESLGVQYIEAKSVPSSKTRPSSQLRESFELGVRSHCYSLLRTDGIRDTRYGRFVESKIRKKALESFEKSYSLFSQAEIQRVFIPNFRYSSQKAALLAAIELDLQVRYFEADGPVNLDRYLNHNYAVHDRLSAQMHALELTSNLTETELRNYADRYSRLRFGLSPVENQYSANWSTNSGSSLLERLESNKGRKIGIFTSSVEEMWGLGDDWQASWESQWEAIEKVMNLPFLSHDSFILRVHPNLGNKERKYFLREIAQIKKLQAKFPSLIVVPHNSDLDTYRLIDVLDLVVVFNSTVGLEATLKMKPVLRLAPTYYDLLVKCPSAEGPDQLSLLSEKSIFTYTGREGAARYIAYKYLRSQPIHERVPMNRNFDYDLPVLKIPLSSMPVAFEPLRFFFVIYQLFFRKLQNRRIKTN